MEKNDKLLTEIYEVGFSINDLVLYLDTHPGDQDALEYFRELDLRRKDALGQFAAECYPLTLDAAGDETEETWTWGSAPAPWEVEANVEL